MPKHRLLNATEELELLKRAQAGDQSARDTLVELNMRLVQKLARKMRTGMDHDEVVQEAIIGLLMAIDRFDCSSGNRLSTYSVPWIRQRIIAAMQRSRPVRQQYDAQTLMAKIRKVEAQWIASHGVRPTLKQLAKGCESTPAKIEAAIAGDKSTAHLVRLDDPELDDPSGAIDLAFERIEARVDAERLIAKLHQTPRGREVMERMVLAHETSETAAMAMATSERNVWSQHGQMVQRLRRVVRAQ